MEVEAKRMNELKSNLRKTYLDWKKKYHYDKYKEDYNHGFMVFYSDGEYDPSLLSVINNLYGDLNK